MLCVLVITYFFYVHKLELGNIVMANKLEGDHKNKHKDLS